MNPKNTEIQTEIQKISPIVANSLPHQRRFSKSEEYFDELEEVLMSHAKISMMTQKERTDIPQGYFETNENNLLKRVKKPMVWHKSWSYVAASLVFVVMAIIFWEQDQIKQDDATEMAWTYIDDNLNNLDWEDLIENQFIEESDIDTYDYIEEEMPDSISQEEYSE